MMPADRIDDKTPLTVEDCIAGYSAIERHVPLSQLEKATVAHLLELQSLRSSPPESQPNTNSSQIGTSPLPEEVGEVLHVLGEAAVALEGQQLKCNATFLREVAAPLIERLGRRVAELEKEVSDLNETIDDAGDMWREMMERWGDDD